MKPTGSVKVVLLQTSFVLLTALFALSFIIALCWIIYSICRRRSNAIEEMPMRETIVVRRPNEQDNGTVTVPDVVNAYIARNGMPATWTVKEGTSSSKTQTTDCEVNQQHDLPVDDQTNEETNDLSNLDTLLEVQEFTKVPDVVITDTTEVEAGQYYILLRSNPKSVQHKGVEAMIKANETLIKAHVEVNEGTLDQVMTESNAKPNDLKGSCVVRSRVDLGMKAKMGNSREMDSMSKTSSPTWV